MWDRDKAPLRNNFFFPASSSPLPFWQTHWVNASNGPVTQKLKDNSQNYCKIASNSVIYFQSFGSDDKLKVQHFKTGFSVILLTPVTLWFLLWKTFKILVRLFCLCKETNNLVLRHVEKLSCTISLTLCIVHFPLVDKDLQWKDSLF